MNTVSVVPQSKHPYPKLFQPSGSGRDMYIDFLPQKKWPDEPSTGEVKPPPVVYMQTVKQRRAEFKQLGKRQSATKKAWISNCQRGKMTGLSKPLPHWILTVISRSSKAHLQTVLDFLRSKKINASRDGRKMSNWKQSEFDRGAWLGAGNSAGGDSTLDIAELVPLLQGLGITDAGRKAKKLMQAFDTDGDGELDVEELDRAFRLAASRDRQMRKKENRQRRDSTSRALVQRCV
eukprot:g2659.t1